MLHIKKMVRNSLQKLDKAMKKRVARDVLSSLLVLYTIKIYMDGWKSLQARDIALAMSRAMSREAPRCPAKFAFYRW